MKEEIDIEPAEQMAMTQIERPAQALGPVNHPATTAAQAKIDAVAALTMKAYDRAGTLNLTPEETAKLQADFPDEAFKPGAAGKESLLYIEHAFLRDRFIEVFGMGGWAMVPRNRWVEPFRTAKGVEGSRVYTEAMLIVRGCFVAEAIGDMDYFGNNASQNYGDATEGSETAAFRRCAKKFGVGLQAWKKDWCSGWWHRKTGKGDPARNQFQRATPAPATAAKPPPATAQAQTPPAAKTPPLPTVANRKWLIDKIGEAGRTTAEAYFRSIEPNPWLMPNEGLEDLELRFVPATMPRFNALAAKLALFATEHKAERPYEPDTRMEVAPAKVPARTTTAPKAEAGPAPRQDPDAFWDTICPVPNKGQKKSDYEASPDTIRSLYAATKAGNKQAQARLFGFANHWKPEPHEFNGKVYQPTKQDHLFREALDAFLTWHKLHENDTKTISDPEPEDDGDELPI